ncbi:MAG TPA: DUF6602 domain-containing protein [Kineosporiaceae bacterium]|nr:DUF6602 domain-containing protein [Kineosporiaceae bacterium]
MTILEDYWSAVLRRLQAEVDGFNSLIEHAGERGRENELALARILQVLMPSAYTVGTGLLIDSQDAASKQCDLVLTDQTEQPRLLAQTNELLHPIETVRAVIEVKSTLDKGEIQDAAEKKASVEALAPCRPQPDGTTAHPIFCLVAYKAATSPASIAKNLRELPPHKRPDLVCLIEPGLVAGRHFQGPGDQDSITDSADPYYCALVPLLNDLGETIPHPVPARTALFEGATYPLMLIENQFLLGHPARALLLFMDALLSELARISVRPAPISANYITRRARHSLPVALARPSSARD